MKIPDRYKMLAIMIKMKEDGQELDVESMLNALFIMKDTFRDQYFNKIYDYLDESLKPTKRRRSNEKDFNCY